MYVSYKVIGRHIRDARKAKGLTQEQRKPQLPGEYVLGGAAPCMQSLQRVASNTVFPRVM